MLGGGAALAGWIASSSAAAAPTSTDRAHIEWHASEPCPSAAAVDALAERLLLTSDADVHATATVSPDEQAGYVLELRIANEPTSRSWRAPDCEQLAELAALVVAIAADPVTVAATIPEPPHAIDDEPRGPATAAAPARRTSRRADRPSKLRAWHGLVAVHGVVGVAELPGLDAGVGLALGIGRGRWRIELGAAHLFAREDEIPRSGGVHARVAAWNTSALACGLFGRRRIGLAICGGPELGAVTAEAHDAPTPLPNTLLWVAGLAGATLDVRLVGPLSLRVGVQAVLALRRPHLVIRDRPPPGLVLGVGGVRATLGLAGHFGPGRADLRGRDQNRRSRGP